MQLVYVCPECGLELVLMSELFGWCNSCKDRYVLEFHEPRAKKPGIFYY